MAAGFVIAVLLAGSLPGLVWAETGVSARPKRIISLVPALTETLFALGEGDRVVAVSRYCNYPPVVARLPRVGDFLSPTVEVVISLSPDLVLTSPSPGNRNAVATLRRSGVRVEVVPEGSGSIGEAEATIKAVATLVGRPGEGDRVVGHIERMLGEIRRRVAGLDRPPAAIVVGIEPLVLAGPRSYLGNLLAAAGADNVAASLGGKWPRTSMEFLLSMAPEVIIDASMDAGGAVPDGKQFGRHWRRFATLPAVAAGRVYPAGTDVFLRPGPRLGEAADILARWIHPEAWQTGTPQEAD